MDALVIIIAALAVLTIGAIVMRFAPNVGEGILPEATQPQQDRVMADLEAFEQANIDRGRCGASNGELVCTLKPHDSNLHLDERRGTQYHSATFTTEAGGAA